jgi:hypothetical protein
MGAIGLLSLLRGSSFSSRPSFEDWSWTHWVEPEIFGTFRAKKILQDSVKTLLFFGADPLYFAQVSIPVVR